MFNCDDCGYKSGNKEDFKDHMKRHVKKSTIKYFNGMNVILAAKASPHLGKIQLQGLRSLFAGEGGGDYLEAVLL